MHILSSADLKDSFRITIRVSNSLDPDQDRRSVGPDLGPNCLQLQKVAASKERVKTVCSMTTQSQSKILQK